LAILAVGTLSSVVLAWLAWDRSKKGDKALGIAANIQSTFKAQQATSKVQSDINDDLRQDVTRLRSAHRECEEATNDLRRALAESHLREDELTREVARQKAQLGEHEETIGRHETTINQLRAGTAADRREH
jgi:chromosome segregation ATPase